MAIFKTAIKSLLGNGLKTWLNVFILSLSFVLIIFMQGLLQGWSRQAVTDSIKWEIADGQYWNQHYDPYDPFSLDSAASIIPGGLSQEFQNHKLEPILIAQGSIYPGGRMMSVLMKGIRPTQNLLSLPTKFLMNDSTEIPAIIGSHMASQANLKENDIITLRWRDANGTFEANDIRIVSIFTAPVPTTDNGIIWLPLQRLQQMMSQPGKATLIIKSPDAPVIKTDGWIFKDRKELTRQTLAMVKAKSAGMSIFYFLFLSLALIAIFDSQMLSIFRRQKEIGTYVSLGMTPVQVQYLFTLEGSMHALLAIVLGGLYGLPFFIYYAYKGIKMPVDAGEFGVPIADKIFPLFTLPLIFGTMLFIFFVTAIVSYLPARKISKMNPTDAIRGKM